MMNPEFARKAAEVGKLIDELYEDLIQAPSRDKIDQTMFIAQMVLNRFCKPVYDSDHWLNHSGPWEERTKEELDARRTYNRQLRERAASQQSWPVPVSVFKGIDYTFARSAKSNSPLERFIEDLKLGQECIGKPTEADGRNGSRLLSNGRQTFPGWVVFQVEEIQLHLNRHRTSDDPLNSFPEWAVWMAPALSLPKLSLESAEDWAGVILEKAELDPCDQGDLRKFLGNRFKTKRDDCNGGRFDTYARQQIMEALEEILS